MPRRTCLAIIFALAVGLSGPAPAVATVTLPPGEHARFEIEGWSIICSGLIDDLNGCSASRTLESADVTMLIDREGGRIHLEGSCADRKKMRSDPIPFPLEPADGNVPQLLDTLFLEAFEGCGSPGSWPLLQSAQRVARILYKITR